MNRITGAGFLCFAITGCLAVTVLGAMMVGIIPFDGPPKFFWVGMVVAVWLIVVGIIVEIFSGDG